MKSKARSCLLILVVFLISLTSGCWNYREVDMLYVVSGVAIDKGMSDRYQVTVELVHISGGKDSKATPKIVSAEGKTIFDAVRNIIAVSGKKLYWSHIKVIIISKDIASEGVSKIIDFIIRDAETREDTPILISGNETAKEILSGESTETILSFALGETLENQKSLGKAQIMDITEYKIATDLKGSSVIIPVIHLKQENEKKIPEIMGTAIIKNDRLAGFLNGEETKLLYFIRDEITYGLLIEEIEKNNGKFLITLEVFKSKTKVKPVVENNNIEFKIDVESKVAIGEIIGKENFFNEEALKDLEQHASRSLTSQIEALIKKVQTDYDADIFGFASKLWESKPRSYNKVSNNWDEVFKNVKVHVHSKITIINSALLEESQGEGE